MVQKKNRHEYPVKRRDCLMLFQQRQQARDKADWRRDPSHIFGLHYKTHCNLLYE